MKKYIASLVLGTVVGIGVVFGSGVVSAEKPTPVGAHRHYVMVNDEKVYVGPNFCELDAAAQGFAAFHHNVHVKFISDDGPIQVFRDNCSPPTE